MLPSKHLLLTLTLLLFSITSSVHGFGPKKKVEVVEAVSEEEAEAVVAAAIEDSAFVNNLFPIISKLFQRKGLGLTFGQVFRAVTDLIDEREMAIYASVGWGLVPATQTIYELYANVTGRGLLDEEEKDGDGIEDQSIDATTTKSKVKGLLKSMNTYTKNNEVVEHKQHKKMKPFKSTRLFQIVEHIGQASKIGFSVIIVDCTALILRMIGYNPWGIMEHVSRIFSKVAYTGWVLLRLSLLKRYLLGKSFGSDLGKMNVVDNLVDGLLYLVFLFHMLNYAEVQTGLAIKSLFSVGATGTLVFGLASKDVASQLMSGLTLHLSEKMYEGDSVRFSDGTSGNIEKMGWFETMIRNSDELVVGIPNTELSGQRVYNLSRTPRSQVKQILRVSYDDATKIPKLLEAIKEEIKKDCPKLITDGSRPFRAHWRNYEDDHLQVVVDAHFMIKPTGGEYWDNRQTMLEAINRAAKKAGVQFERLVRAAVKV